MAKKKEIAEDVIIDEVKPNDELESVEEESTNIEEAPVEEEEKPEEITLDEVKPNDELPPIEVIDTNNNPINNDAIGDVEVPMGFAPIHKINKIGTMGNYNGRIYKVINNTHGIWCDNGVAFPLSNLK